MTHRIANPKTPTSLEPAINSQPSTAKFKAWGKALTIPVLLLLLSEYFVRAGWIESYLLPAPSSLWQTFTDLANGDLWQHIWASSFRVFIGFLIGSFLALFFAVLVGLNKQAEEFLEPSFSAIKSIPSLAWIPLLLLWLGIDEASKIKGVDRKLIEVAQVYRLKYWQLVQQIILPAASPGILTGLRNGLSLSWMFMIAAELIAATQGIGYLLSDGRETSRPDIVILAIILLAVLGKLTDRVMQSLETWLLRWRDVIKH